MKGSAWTHEGSKIFPFQEGGGQGFYNFFFLSLFSSCSLLCSHEVPKDSPSSQVFPQNVPNSTSLLAHIWFAQSLTLIYINWKGGQKGAHLFLFGNWLPKEVLLLGRLPNAPKNWELGSGPPTSPPKKNKNTHLDIQALTILSQPTSFTNLRKKALIRILVIIWEKRSKKIKIKIGPTI